MTGGGAGACGAGAGVERGAAAATVTGAGEAGAATGAGEAAAGVAGFGYPQMNSGKKKGKHLRSFFGHHADNEIILSDSSLTQH